MNETTIAFAKGGEDALKYTMKMYSYPLLRYCHNILCDYHEAQDALQITFIKAYNRRHTYKSSMQLSPWLYKIAYNTCVDILRKRKPDINVQQQSYTLEETVIPDNILKALHSLSALDRALVYARIMEERPYDELAKIHSKSAAALRKRYERAKNRLADMLKDDYPFYAKSQDEGNDKVKESV